MRRSAVFSFTSTLLASVAAVALMPSGAGAQQSPYGHYGQGTQQLQQFGHGNSQQGYSQQRPLDQYGQNYGQDQFSRYDQNQFGPQDFGQAGRYQQYGSRQHYGLQPYGSDAGSQHYGSREQYGLPPSGGSAQGYGQAYDQPHDQPRDQTAQRDYRGPQGFNQYGLGQQRFAPSQYGQYGQGFHGDQYGDRPERGSDYHQLGQMERMLQPPSASDWNQMPEESIYVQRDDLRQDHRSADIEAYQPGQIIVASASDLVGRSLRDLEGNRAGRIEYVMVNAGTGEVSFAIVGSGGGLDIGDSYIAVPWSALIVRPGDERTVVLNASRDRLRQAPRVTSEELASLASPSRIAHVTNYYATPAPEGTSEQASQGQQAGSQQGGAEQQVPRIEQALQQAGRSLQQDDRQSALQAVRQAQGFAQQALQSAQGQQQQTFQQVQAPLRQATQALEQNDTQQAEEALNEAQQQIRQAASQLQPSGEQASGQRVSSHQDQQSANRQTPQASGPGMPAILIGRRIVTMLHPPILVSPTDLRGTEVVGPHGRYIGAIDQVMIDVERGHVAYLLLSTGGFLGMDESWIPVAFQAMEWSPRSENYVLNVNPQQLQAMPVLRKEALPATVSSRQLAALHQQFGVTPYWQATAMAGLDRGGRAGSDMQAAGISPDELRRRLERQGFTKISDLARDGGTYNVTATRNDQTYDLSIDASTGAVESSRLTADGVRAMLQNQGYTEISDLTRFGDTYEATAQVGDRQVDLQIDAQTGVVQMESES